MQERRINVRAIIYKDGKILAQKFKTKIGVQRDYWGTPGGGLDSTESIIDGLQREIVEETGVMPIIDKLACVHQFIFKRSDGIEREMLELFFMINNVDDYFNINLANTTHGAIEIARCEFVDPASVNILPKFLQSFDYENVTNNSVLIDSEL